MSDDRYEEFDWVLDWMERNWGRTTDHDTDYERWVHMIEGIDERFGLEISKDDRTQSLRCRLTNEPRQPPYTMTSTDVPQAIELQKADPPPPAMYASTATEVSPQPQPQEPTVKQTYQASTVPTRPTRPPAQFIVGTDPSIEERRRASERTFGFGFMFIRAGTLHFAGERIASKTMTVVVMMHGANIDLSRAIFVHPITTIRVLGICGGVRIMIPRGVQFQSTGVGVCGGFKGLDSYSGEANNPTPDSPVVRVVGLVVCGGAGAECNAAVEPLVIVHQDLALA